MSGLFAGLEKLGLSNVKDMDIFEKEENKVQGPKKEIKVAHVLEEKDMIFDRTFRCPVCDREFKSKVVMSGKAKLVSVDTDLRPKYQGIDCIKYDAIVCDCCGYAALNRFFNTATYAQSKMIKENISRNFRPIDFGDVTYSYDDAILRYQLALANAVVKKSKASERAYICLKTAWLYRGKAESLDMSYVDYEEKLEECRNEEKKFIANAYEGFISALSKEIPPICGMDEPTFMYVTADLARRCKDYDVAKKLVSQIIISRTAAEKVKDRARDLKELIKQELSEINI